MKPRYLILAGTLTFLAGVLIQAPAALVYAWIAPKAQIPLGLIGITGTLTHGKAAQARYGNQVLIADVDWTLRPLNLLMAQLRYRLHSDKVPLILDGEVSQGFGGTGFHQMKATGDLRAMAEVAGQAFVPVNGTLDLDLISLQLRDDWPVSADGVAQLNGVAWTLSKEPVPLGDYQAQVRTEGDQIIAQISTRGGSVEIGGEARLKTDRSYSYSLKLKPKADAPPMIVNLMKQLGTPDAQGSYTLNREGKVAEPVKELSIEEIDEQLSFGAPSPK
ncbi:MAG: type II secretion system protein N [Pseudomonadota bacterium]|nr:type II secretion system protein N [Pseudomonadota bacterium]